MKFKIRNKAKFYIPVFLFGILFCNASMGDTIIKFTPVSTTCNNSDDGKIKIFTELGNIKVKIQIYSDSTFQKFVKEIIVDKKELVVENLEAKDYYIKYIYNDNQWIENVTVTEPEKLKPGTINIEKGLDNVSKSDAILVSNPIGGTEPYTYKWSENAGNQKTQKAFNIEQGTYYCEINDANNCGPVRATIFFNRITYPEKIKN